jgi:hypothetical protein
MLLLARGSSQILAIISVLTSCLGVFSGILLVVRMGTLQDVTDGVDYLSSVRSARFGYFATAVVFSLPRALCFWSLFLLISQVIIIALHRINLSLAITAGILILAFMKVITIIIWPRSGATCPVSDSLCRFFERRRIPETDSKV